MRPINRQTSTLPPAVTIVGAAYSDMPLPMAVQRVISIVQPPGECFGSDAAATASSPFLVTSGGRTDTLIGRFDSQHGVSY